MGLDRKDKDESKIKLKEYEEICPKCNGKGYIGKFKNNIIGYGSNWCIFCRGVGFIDWIDKIKRGDKWINWIKEIKNMKN